MKFKFDKKYIAWGMTAFFTVVAIILFYYLLFHSSNISSAFKFLFRVTMPIVDGFILAYLLTPILNAIEFHLVYPIYKHFSDKKIDAKKKKMLRNISIILTVLFTMFLLYLFFSTVIPQIFVSIQSIAFQFPFYVDNLLNYMNKLLSDNPEIESYVMNIFNQYSGDLINYINNNVLPQINTIIRTLSLSLLGFIKATWNLIIGFIISIYVLGSKEHFVAQAKKLAYAMFDTKTANSLIRDFRFTNRTFIGFIGGKVVDSIIIGFICFAGTSVIGTPYGVLVSVIVGITNIIPFFGPYLGAVPSALLILMVDPKQCLYFIIFIVILQQFDGNVLGPKILGDSTGLSGFWVIFSITLFSGFFGIAGMIVGVPVFAVFYALVKRKVNNSLKKKELPVNTLDYFELESMKNNQVVKKPDSGKIPFLNQMFMFGDKSVNYVKDKINKQDNDESMAMDADQINDSVINEDKKEQ